MKLNLFVTRIKFYGKKAAFITTQKKDVFHSMGYYSPLFGQGIVDMCIAF